MADETFYDRVGGQAFFDELVERFYAGVVDDEILFPMYQENLEESKRHLSLFLAQYWGGPALYMSERGHPRLRMRHAPFRITKRARDAWLVHMRAAATQMADRMTAEDAFEFDSYIEMAAHQLRNV
jgi:hemoglobin